MQAPTDGGAKKGLCLPDALELIHFLRKSEFRIGAGEVLRVTKLLQYLSDSGITTLSPEQAALWLAPLICTTPRQQAILPERLKVFGDGPFPSPVIDSRAPSSRHSTTEPTPLPTVLPPVWPKWATVATLLLLFVLLVSSIRSPIVRYTNKQSTTVIAPTKTSDAFSKPTEPNEVLLRLSEAAPIVGLPLLLWLLYLRYRPDVRPAIQRQRSNSGARKELRTHGDGLRLFNNDDLIHRAGDDIHARQAAFEMADRIRRALQGMRTYRMTRSSRPDVNASVRATARAGGYPTVVRGLRARLPDYPILIETRSGRDHLPAIAYAIADRLTLEGVHHTLYLFDTDPRLLRTDSPYPQAVSLADIAARYDQDVLVVISDGDCLLDPLSGMVRPWVAELESWRSVVLLTPLPSHRWSWRERRIASSGVVVLQASPRGLIDLGELLRSQGKLPNTALLKRPARLSVLTRDGGRTLNWHSDTAPDPDDRETVMEAIQLELSPRLFEFFCTLALFPELRPDLTLHAARALRGKHGASLIDEAGYASLCTLPWFRAGRVPDWLRLDLVHSLSEFQLAQAHVMYERWLGHEGYTSLPPVRISILNRLRSPSEPSDRNPIHDAIFLSFIQKQDLTELDLEVSPTVARKGGLDLRKQHLPLAFGAVLATLLLWLAASWSDVVFGKYWVQYWRPLWYAMTGALVLGQIGGALHSLRRSAIGRFGLAPVLALMCAALSTTAIWAGKAPLQGGVVVVALSALMLPCIAMACAPALPSYLTPIESGMSSDRGITIPGFILIGLGLISPVWLIVHTQVPYLDPRVIPSLGIYGAGIALLQASATQVRARIVLVHAIPGALFGYGPGILVSAIPQAGVGTAFTVVLLLGAVGAQLGCMYGVSSVRKVDIRPGLLLCAASAAIGFAIILLCRLQVASGKWADLGFLGILPLAIVLPPLTLCMPFAIQHPSRLVRIDSALLAFGAAAGGVLSAFLVSEIAFPELVNHGVIVDRGLIQGLSMPVAMLASFIVVPIARASLLVDSGGWRSLMDGLHLLRDRPRKQRQGILVVALWIICVPVQSTRFGVLDLKWLALPLALFLAAREERGTFAVLAVGLGPLLMTSTGGPFSADPGWAAFCAGAYLFATRYSLRQAALALPQWRFHHIVLALLVLSVSFTMSDTTHGLSLVISMSELAFWFTFFLGITQTHTRVVVPALFLSDAIAIAASILAARVDAISQFRFIDASIGLILPFSAVLAYAIGRVIGAHYVRAPATESQKIYWILLLLLVSLAWVATWEGSEFAFMDLTTMTRVEWHALLLVTLVLAMLFPSLSTSARPLALLAAGLAFVPAMLRISSSRELTWLSAVVVAGTGVAVGISFRRWLDKDGVDWRNAVANTAAREAQTSAWSSVKAAVARRRSHRP